jgi:hypothetical protein
MSIVREVSCVLVACPGHVPCRDRAVIGYLVWSGTQRTDAYLSHRYPTLAAQIHRQYEIYRLARP